MEYRALTIGLTDELFSGIQAVLTSSNLRLTPSLTVRDAGYMLEQQMIHLLIVDLEYLRSIRQDEWLNRIRCITFIPVIILSDDPEQDTGSMVKLGADICVSGKGPCSMIADLAFAQLRRSTEYNQKYTPGNTENHSFRAGDIFIDPARRIVEVRGRSVNLRPREFSLLLYFMRNPNIVLTSEQICEEAWGMGGSYNRGVAQPVRLLRLAIEPNPTEPIYIETVRLVGYRFTAYSVETCDNC